MNKKINAKDAFAESLFELCKKRSIDKITVGQITENAGYSRKCFYNNFDSKFSLFVYVFQKETDAIIAQYSETEPWNIVLGRIYRFMYQHKYLFGKNCKAEDLELLRAGMIRQVEYYYLRSCEELNGKDSVTEEIRFLSRYNAYGATNIIIDWLKNDWDMSPEEIGVLLGEALPPLLYEKTQRYQG